MGKGKKRHKRAPGTPSTFKQQLDAKAVDTGLTKLPTPAIVATIDTLIGILQGRGVKIRDWDNKTRVVQKMKCIGGKVFILAPPERPETEAATHGESGEPTQGQGAPNIEELSGPVL